MEEVRLSEQQAENSKEVKALYEEFTTIKNLEAPKNLSNIMALKNEDSGFKCFKDLVDSQVEQHMAAINFTQRKVDKSLFNVQSILDFRKQHKVKVNRMPIQAMGNQVKHELEVMSLRQLLGELHQDVEMRQE